MYDFFKIMGYFVGFVVILVFINLYIFKGERSLYFLIFFKFCENVLVYNFRYYFIQFLIDFNRYQFQFCGVMLFRYFNVFLKYLFCIFLKLFEGENICNLDSVVYLRNILFCFLDLRVQLCFFYVDFIVDMFVFVLCQNWNVFLIV